MVTLLQSPDVISMSVSIIPNKITLFLQNIVLCYYNASRHNNPHTMSDQRPFQLRIQCLTAAQEKTKVWGKLICFIRSFLTSQSPQFEDFLKVKYEVSASKVPCTGVYALCIKCTYVFWCSQQSKWFLAVHFLHSVPQLRHYHSLSTRECQKSSDNR